MQRLTFWPLNRYFQFHKRGQHFIGTHDETLSVAVRVHNLVGRLNLATTSLIRPDQIVALGNFANCSERFAVRLCSLQAVRSLSGFVPLIQQRQP